MIDAMITGFKKLFSIDLLQESKQMRKQTGENISASNVMLQLNGEERWMLKMCKENKDGKEECLPNDKH